MEEALDQLRVFGRGTIQAEHKRAWAVENLGLVRRRQGRWRDTVELHTWSLSAFGELADRFGNAHAEANLGNAYAAGRKSQAALARYQRTLDLFTGPRTCDERAPIRDRPQGSFGLSRSIGFLEEWPVTQRPAEDSVLRFSFCAEHDWRPVGVHVSQRGRRVDIDT